MPQTLISRVPAKIKEKLGSRPAVCLLNGADVFSALRHENMILMACNPRIRHVIPGIMKAAEELDAVIAFELTRTEGGLDGGYTGQTPEVFFDTVVEYAHRCGFSKPFILHGDHTTVTAVDAAEIEGARTLIAGQIAAGYTSFAIDASFTPLTDNIEITADLARTVVAEGYGLEVELGEVKPVGVTSNLTTVAETEEFLTGLAARGIRPHLLAIDNGSKRGNYLDGEMVRIDLERTRQIHETTARHGLSGLVQHGITGTPLRIVGKLAEYGIRKGNIGTLWQNVAHAGLPLDLMDAMRRWAKENGRDIKFATRPFKADIDAIPEENARQIVDMAYREAKEFLLAFHARGSASRLAQHMKESPCA
ncbi:class II fructose-bisphosphate aldolase [Geobacter pickeringii]|uniref:Fructose-bisphosphate aldolase n=1 Tax=Geobacter pickeringii TaxID=345632 RepID=A0A0B5BAL8_9BACT|nr:class II fructose-bisphosphate aldolase [Geobacter pickeringii]AJE03622.1 fructose-bisphosphate aldolase [Geobacter pickeringii]